MYKTDRRRWLGLLATLGVAPIVLPSAAAAETAQKDTLEKILQSNSIRVGWIPYLTASYRDLNTGKVDGYMVEVLEAITKDLGIPKQNIKYVETDWASFAVGLQGGKYDVSIAATFATIGRARAASFTRPLFYLGNSALARKGDERFSDLKSVYDLDRPNIKIAVVSGEQSDEFTKTNFHRAQIDVINAADITAAMLQVSTGRADVAMADAGAVHDFAMAHPNTVDIFAGHPWGVQPISWSVRPGEETFLNFLNTSISYLDSMGVLERLMRKPAYKNLPFLVLENHPKVLER